MVESASLPLSSVVLQSLPPIPLIHVSMNRVNDMVGGSSAWVNSPIVNWRGATGWASLLSNGLRPPLARAYMNPRRWRVSWSSITRSWVTPLFGISYSYSQRRLVLHQTVDTGQRNLLQRAICSWLDWLPVISYGTGGINGIPLPARTPRYVGG